MDETENAPTSGELWTASTDREDLALRLAELRECIEVTYDTGPASELEPHGRTVRWRERPSKPI